MSSKKPPQRYRLAAMLSLALLVGSLAGQSLSAPAPAPAQQPSTSPFGRLVPMAPVGQGAAPAPGAGIPAQSAAPVAAAPAPAAPAAAAPAPAGAASGVQAPRIVVIDRQALLQRSAAGKDIFTQTQTLSKQLETQLRTE